MNLYHSFKQYAPPFTNLVERLRYWTEHQPSEPAFYYLDDQEQLSQFTYLELDRKARAIAARLTAMGLQGQRALLLYPSGLEFVAAFFGCLYAGTTAVPALPPRRNRNMTRVEAISENAQAAAVLSVQSVVQRSASLLDDAPHLNEVPWIATDQVAITSADEWAPAELSDDTLAVLQYTSGSTGQPKGVMLSHSNLIHNCALITHGFEADRTSLGLSWLPTYHDMGLVGGILNPLYVGRPNILMSPMSFLQKPIRWLRAISRFGVTISGGPNFAYALCNEKITDQECQGLDLSCWKVAFNGAEPIRAETIARFSQKFGPYGFRTQTHYPCYGMAEATLIVSGTDCQEEPVVRTFDAAALELNRVSPNSDNGGGARRLVGSGRILLDQQVLIVHPETCEPCSSGQVGEIWVTSKSVAQGYWNNGEETKRVFYGQLADSENGRFLRTGDLGFFDDDQLFITGRTKDLIIINGRNLYPHDIELVVERAHKALRIGGGVAFSIDSENGEQLIIAQELERGYRKHDLDEIASAIRIAVFDLLDLVPHAVLLLRTGQLPKTSSGKLQRFACREKYLSAELDALAHWQPGEQNGSRSILLPTNLSASSAPNARSIDSIESWLVNKLAERLKTPPSQVDVDRTFAHFGLDSVTLIGLSGELEDFLSCSVSPKVLFVYPTIAELSAHLATVVTGYRESLSETRVLKSLTSDDSSVGQGEVIETVLEQSASELLTHFNDLSKSQIEQLLKSLLQEKARQEIKTHNLSLGQRALWFIYQMDPNNSAYNIMYAARVRTDFDRIAFCRSMQTIIDRHEVLRTTYSTNNGLPVQNVHSYEKFELQTVDARDWKQAELDAEIQSSADAPFDLESGPVIRVKLFQRTGNHHILLFVVHHIALDFWSLDLLFDELEAIYRQEVTGQKAKLASVNVSYSDFIRWQEQLMEDEEGLRQWEYWRDKLAGNLPVLNLPTNYPRPPIQSFRGTSYPFKLPRKLSNKLIEISKSQGVTLFTTYLAAFQVLMYRYTGQNDVLVGCPTAGRNCAEFENVLGDFVNPIVLRTQLSADIPFTRFLEQVRETLIGGITHQDFPFPLLVERLQFQRDASRSPIFQVAFGWDQPRKLYPDGDSFRSSNGKPADRGLLGLEPLALAQQGAAFDLMMMVLNTGDRVSAALQYNLDLFDESTVVCMADHFQTLLESIVDNPECPIADLPLLSKKQQHVRLTQWNDTAAEYPRKLCLHEMIEAQVRQTPDAIAIECNGQQLTYCQLDRQSNQLAHNLAKLDVGPDVLVGVYLDRSIQMMVGLLGILKAGGAFVPLSPGTPSERLAYMLDTCNTSVVLTQEELADDLAKWPGKIICLDNDRSEHARESNTDRVRRANPSNLAYVIFTSGSTGQPKGVLIEHRSVVNFLTSMQQAPGIVGDDVLLAVTPFTFDISVLELFLPLSVGAKVVVAGPGVAVDGIALSRMIVETQATIMQATPTTWRLLVEAGWKGDDRLKILCGGESLPPDLAQPLLERCASLWNMYGPTETTIWSAVDHVQQRSDPMPIGRPIANTQVYILDSRLRPVPIGVTGELYIGGDGVARGYLNRPELTAEKFVRDPFCGSRGATMYKTGDLARYRANGKIEFLGRGDLQVKVRGFRIELGEIETHLTEHPAIRQAAVMAHASNSQIDDKQLVAYFTFRGDSPNATDLRDFLKQKLPDYMVPSAYVPLDEFPLNSSGKVDRKALPAPRTARPNLRAQYVAPRNDTEKTLAQIWARVLGLDVIGVYDNFFDLGGASMHSLEVTTLAGEAGIQMTPALLFKHPSISELSASGLSQTNDGINNPRKIKVCERVQANKALQLFTEPESLDTANLKTKKNNIIIESIGVYLPAKSVTTDEIIAGCKNKILFPLEELTSIKSRRLAADDEFTSDIASHAVVECLDNSKYTSDQIDLIICCHIGRDEMPQSAALEPGTSMYLKQRFHFANAIALDITNACAGMFTGISIAESYIHSGAARRVMVISAEHISPVMKTAQKEISGFLDPRMACLTLGDAGAAILLEASSNHEVGFHELEMYSLSKYSRMCIGQPTEQEHGGPILLVPDPITQTTIAIENSIAHSKLVLDRSPWKPQGIQHVIMHQTSQRSLLDGARAINQAFGRQICTTENTINNLESRGNTASTSHFVAIWDFIRNGRIKSGDNIVFGITGSGQTIGTGLYTFDDLPERIRRARSKGSDAISARKITSDATHVIAEFGSDPLEPAKPVTGRSKGSDAISARKLASHATNVTAEFGSDPLELAICTRIRVESIGVLTHGHSLPIETIPMVKQAVENCLAQSEYDKSEMDLVLYAGVYRTGFISEPALATLIAGELDINAEIKPTDSHRTLAFDVLNGGVGLLNACDIAAQMMRSGKVQTALIIVSEIENNRDHYPGEVMGLQETASAIILDQDPRARIGFGEFVFKYLPDQLAARTVTGKYINGRPCVYLRQDPSILDLYLKIVPQAVNEILEREKLSESEISVVLPPQFSSEFLDRLGHRLEIPRERFVDLTGDGKDWLTSALPYSMHEVETRQRARPGDIGLVINVGSGLQVGCAIYYF